jgi:hypothetical protein
MESGVEPMSVRPDDGDDLYSHGAKLDWMYFGELLAKTTALSMSTAEPDQIDHLATTCRLHDVGPVDVMLYGSDWKPWVLEKGSDFTLMHLIEFAGLPRSKAERNNHVKRRV